MTTIPAYTIGGITRPELHLDSAGNIVLDPAAEAFAALYGLKFLYLGCPPNTPWPPVQDSLSTPVDSNATANSVLEGAAANTVVNVTAHATSTAGLPVTYSLIGDTSAGGFKIDPNTGVVTVNNPAKLDFESAAGHAYTITVKASDGILTSQQTFTISVADVAPSTPTDSNAATNHVAEGAAVNTLVGITATSSDVNGGAVTFAITGDTSGGGFKVDPHTGVVSVADGSKIDYESAAGHAYSVTVTASDGTLTSAQTFSIGVDDVTIGAPTDSNAAANHVAEGAAAGTIVGITASAIDPNGPATTYSLIGDTSGGGFTINAATGVVTVADSTKVDFETAAGHNYSVTVQATNGATTTSSSFTIAVDDAAPSSPVDSNAAANSVTEGAANGSTVGITASSTDVNGPAVTYSLIGDTSGGGFTINAATGVITVADSTKLDYETAAGHAYTVTAQASDGTLASSQTFTIAVNDVAPSIPVDSNASANSVAEGASAGSTVGITASSTDVNGPAVTYSLTGDTSGGGFTINAATGVVTVADPTKIDYESSGAGHSYTITAQASDGTLTSSQTFTIAVTDAAPSTPVDSDAAANSVVEGAANGSTVGITASSTDVNGPAVTYSLIGDTSGGGFTINAATGVITVADSTKIDFETSGAGHSYTVTAQASDGVLASSQTFTIAVSDVAPSTPVDSDAAANTVAEGTANGSTVGITASSTDVNGPAVTYSLIGDTSGGAFTINAATGVITVADTTKLDFESSGAGHSYTVTAQASDGTLASSQTFTIGVTDVAPSTPVDSDAAANSVAEGAAAGSTVGVTAASTDVNGPPVTWSLTGDTSGGGFTINATTGVITVADPTKIDFESSGAGHSYTVTAQSSDGTLTSSQTFTIAVADVSPSTPVDADANTNTIAEGAANGSTVGVTASSTDVNGPAVTYSLIGDTSGGGFTINAATGVVTIADSTKIDFETSGGSYTVTAQASDGTLASSHAFVIAVTDVAPSTPVDSDGATNQVSMNAPVGTYTGVTASSTDVNGPAVTYSLVGDTSGGGFTVDPTTGQVKVADSTKIPYNAGSPSFDVTVQASDGTLTSQQTFTIGIVPNTPPVANDDSLSATEAGGANNAIAGSNPSGNVILGTGSAGAVQDTDAQDASSALTVVAVHTGAEGASTGTGTVGQDLIGSHGTLHLNSDGSYTYAVNQNDAQVQALHTSADTINDQFNYTIQDTGGLQDTATITFTIHGADDLPVAVADTGTMTEDDAPTSFNVIANDSQDPDSTASNAITLGPGGITVTGPVGTTFVNTDATASIVSNQVQVTLDNAHFQQLALGEHATVTVPYTLTGDAGETSSANLVVTVNGVNDVPVAVDDSGTMTEDQSGHAFTVLTNDTLDADHSAPNNVTAGAVSNLSAPSGENIDLTDVAVSVNGSNQIVVNLGSDFQHLQDGESATFDVAYTLHGDQAGDTSTASLHVTVTGINDAPTASNFTFNGANSAIGNTDLVVNDPTDGAPDPAGPQKTISGSLLSGASDIDGPGPLIVVAGTIATAQGGTVTMQSDGDFIYKPAVGFTGSDSFNYQVSDQNAGASGVGLGTGTVTINVATPKVWYVNAATGSDTTGDGSSEKPFASLAPLSTGGSADALDGPNDTIFLYNGTYNSGIVLENGQQLIAQNQGLTVNGTTLEAATAGSVTINGTVTLASGNTIDGVSFGNTSGFSLQDSGASVGTATVAHSSINNANGGAVNIANGGTLAMNFSSISASGTTTSAISLNNTTGSFTGSGGTLNNGAATAADVSITGANNVNFTYGGNINDTTGSTVAISSQTGGTKDFNGSINGGAISLTNNTGATMSFDGGVTLSTGAANAFTATGGGTVSVTGATNTLATTTGTALNVTNTNIGASGLTFKSISATGSSGSAGIVLDTTGSAGGLTVTGDGTAGSGGTINNKTGADILTGTDAGGQTTSGTGGTGIYLHSTSNVSLSNMSLHDFSNFAIYGNNVTGFTLANSTISGTNGSNNAGDREESSIRFDNLLGAASITGSSISGGFDENVDLYNTSGTLNRLTMDNNTFGLIGSTGNDNVRGQVFNSATANYTVTNSTFAGTRADFIAFVANNNSSMDVVVRGNTFHNGQTIIPGGGTAVDVRSGSGGLVSAATTTFDISHNTLTDGGANAFDTVGIFVAKGQDNGTMSGTIASNAIGPAKVNSNSDGIFVRDAGAGSLTTLIQNNTITGVGNNGIHLQNNDGSSTLNASIYGNSVSSPTSTVPFAALLVDNGATATDTSTTNVVIGSGTGGAGSKNTLNHSSLYATDVELSNFNASTHLNLSRNGSGSGTVAGVITDDNTSNTGGITVDTSGGNGTTTLVNTLPTLPAPVAPLLTQAGGVQATTPTTGEMNLTQSELDLAVTAAIAQWAAAGASAAQIAAMHAVTFSVADLSGQILGQEGANHITIDTDAAGHGWFTDTSNAAFTHAVNSSGTDLLTDPSSAAAGHMDLLTTVAHELGHVIGLPDSTASSDVHDLMFIGLADGERRLASAADVAQANASAASQTSSSFVSDNGGHNFVFSEPPVPAATTPPAPPVLSAILAALQNAQSFPVAWFTGHFVDPNGAPWHSASGTPVSDSHDIGGGMSGGFTVSAAGSPVTLSPTALAGALTLPDTHYTLPDPSHGATLPDTFQVAPIHGGLLI
ncbi:cadherin domain-containing protein [Bradyrhizobium jicamae]|uniref:cadherin domain-containing protein n=1 Tax=Bradyrhizobium jicamae TaxID=280332 RepID=UPI001BA63BFD|nr:cadherin domain-containing protein [Bradyrhizobium jicamae]MBR0757582.1 cadherin domain-containing protein [Bradyrhizobium jicamae]